MNLHEYQAKEILESFGVPVPPFGVAGTTSEIQKIIRDLNLSEGVVKIQVHAGGRGKAGGVKFARTADEIFSVAEHLIGMKMINNQTGPQGVIAKKVLISKPVDIQKEYYLGAVIDREQARPILIASSEGGMEIEEIALKTPEKILKLPIELTGEIKHFRLVRLANFMGWQGKQAQEGMKIAQKIANAFIKNDASLLEINPLVLDKQGDLWALDAKLSVDE
ncbi:MAG: succinate--CoA ligase subunit beta, partial [Chlamydiae bacterium]|nr:succinate--CoA ligase subunit beta [Chlamydiota bacterium]